jgi:hypothetical protein
MLAKDVAALVSMPRLLNELGFSVNERSRRCPCILHAGANPSSFSWNEAGEWYCFTQCGGGDRISLVMAARLCNFKVALQFLATLAGVSLDDSAKVSSQIAKERRERQDRETKEARLKAMEKSAFLESRSEVLELEFLRKNAGRRLARLIDEWSFDEERFPGEKECAWAALQLVAQQIPRAAAAFTVISFADSEARMRFSEHPEQRAALIEVCLEIGGVHSKGHLVEFVL